MTVLAELGLTQVAEGTMLDAMKNKAHLNTAAGPEVRAFLTYLGVYGYADRTQENYERAIARMVNLHPDLPFNKYQDAHILATLKTFPPASRVPVGAALRAFFKWGKTSRRIRENPLDYLPPQRRKKQPDVDTFTPVECDDLLSLPSDDSVLMALLLGFGLRKSEAAELQVRRLKVAEDPAYIIVAEGNKGGKPPRKAYGLPDKAQIVREYLLLHDLEPQDHLWYLRPGGRKAVIRNRRPSDSTMQDWWTRSLDEAGVRPDAGLRERNMHITRHTYATEWLRRGGRLETLSKSLGHSSIQVTADLYVHLDERDVLIDLATIAETPAF